MARQYRSTVEAKTLSAGINSSVTSMTLNSVTTLPSTYPYTLVIDPDTATEEIVTVTASGGGNVLTITRGQDGTSAQSHNSAAVVKHMITARDLQEPHDHIDATAAHGATGAVVGTTNTQTLTNKTLTSPTINTPTITGAVVTSANIVDGTIVNADINASAAIDWTKLTVSSTVSSTEIGYLDGVTSAIQTQLNSKITGGSAISMGTNSINFSATSGGSVYLDGPTGTVDGNLTLELPLISTGSEVLVADTTTQTLTNKTLTYPVIDSNSGNTKVGTSALAARTTGINNTALGLNALDSMTSGEENTAIGSNALNSITTSVYNVAVGSNALTNATSGQLNTAVGTDSAPSVTTGSNNTILGYNAAISLTTGSNNTVIGYNANTSTATVSNQVVLGNSSITDLRCQDTTISAPSDIRDKTDVQPIPVGLDFINDIRPVNFEWNMRDGGQVGNRQGGFIAQEVLAVEQQYNTRNWLGMVNDENPDQLVLAPAKLIPVMVKALQELSEQVEELKAKVAELEAK